MVAVKTPVESLRERGAGKAECERRRERDAEESSSHREILQQYQGEFVKKGQSGGIGLLR